MECEEWSFNPELGWEMAPSSSTFKVVSLRLFLDAETRVSELISQDSAYWNSQVVDAIFLPHEVELIKGIPISMHLPEDELVWAATSNGLFSVSSAYRLALEPSRPANQGTNLDGSSSRRF